MSAILQVQLGGLGTRKIALQISTLGYIFTEFYFFGDKIANFALLSSRSKLTVNDQTVNGTQRMVPFTIQALPTRLGRV